MTKEICTKMQQSTCVIKVYEEGELVSSGSGFAFSERGEVFTAAHVVTGQMPLREEDFYNPDSVIICKFLGLPECQYKVAIPGVKIQVEGFREAIDLDFCGLMPVQPWANNVPYLEAMLGKPDIGSTVYFGGFSDEIELPFGFDRLLDHQSSGVKPFFEAMARGYEADMTQIICKRGMVANVRTFNFSNSKTKQTVEGSLFYIDNGIHSGASGGPVVDQNGHAIGLITQRAVTTIYHESEEEDQPPRMQKMLVPSGSTLALALDVMNFRAEFSDS